MYFDTVLRRILRPLPRRCGEGCANGTGHGGGATNEPPWLVGQGRGDGSGAATHPGDLSGLGRGHFPPWTFQCRGTAAGDMADTDTRLGRPIEVKPEGDGSGNALGSGRVTEYNAPGHGGQYHCDMADANIELKGVRLERTRDLSQPASKSGST